MANNHPNYADHPEQVPTSGFVNVNAYMQPPCYFYGANGSPFESGIFPYYLNIDSQPKHRKESAYFKKDEQVEFVRNVGDKKSNEEFLAWFHNLTHSSTAETTNVEIEEAEETKPEIVENSFLNAIYLQKGPDIKRQDQMDLKNLSTKESVCSAIDLTREKNVNTVSDFKTAILERETVPTPVVKKTVNVSTKQQATPGLLVRKTSTIDSTPSKIAKYGLCKNGCVSYTKADIAAITYSADEFSSLIDIIKKLLFEHKAVKSRIKKSESAWVGISEKIEAGHSVSNEAKYSFKILSILNKLSIKSFHKLFAEFSKMDFYTEIKIDEFVSVLFSKATRESSFCYLYADFVNRSFKLLDKPIYEEKNLLGFLKGKLIKLISQCLIRSKEEESKIAELRAFKTNDEETLDEVLNELEEREKNYKKPILGALQFVSDLYSIKAADDETMLKIYNSLKENTDLFGIELLVKFIQYSGDLVYAKSPFKAIIDEELSKLDKIKRSLSFEIRFAIVDTMKMKSEGFKNAVRKFVPATEDGDFLISNKQKAYNILDKKRLKTGIIAMSKNRNNAKRNSAISKPVNQFSYLEYAKPIREAENIPKEKPVIREPAQPKKWTNMNPTPVAEKPVNVPAATEKKIDLEVIVPDLLMTEFDIDEAFFEARDYQMNKYALDYCKIAFRVILENKRMHLSFGLLLVRLISSFTEFKACLHEAIKYVLEDLPMNAMDEPILWTRFYYIMIPLCSANCITLDDLVHILSRNEEVESPLRNIEDLFKICKKELTEMRILKIMDNNKNSETLKKLMGKQNIFEDAERSLLVASKNNLLNDFYNTSISNAMILNEVKDIYSDFELAITDIARETYLNCLFGKEFNSGLTNIFIMRKEVLAEICKLDGAGLFLKCFMDRVIKFDSKFDLFSNIGLAMCKSEYLDIDRVQKIPSSIQNEEIQERISIQVGVVVNNLKK